MSVVAVIPARYGSTRFPGKPLAAIGGKPMIQHVYESAAKARDLDRVLVATDDRRIEQAVKSFGGEVMMTSKHHASGTDRLAEVARKIKSDWLVNVQGDLPFIHAETIARAVRPLRRDRAIPMSTVCTPIYDAGRMAQPKRGQSSQQLRRFCALFLSSADSIPAQRQGRSKRRKAGAAAQAAFMGLSTFRTVCISARLPI